MKGISDTKLVTFALGQQKKSRFQKTREEKEAKKKAEDVAVAAVYDSFVASFNDDDKSSSSKGKNFLRGGRVQSAFAVDDDIEDNSNSSSNSGGIYRLERRPRAGSAGADSEMDKIVQEMKEREAERSQRSNGSNNNNSSSGSKPTRQIDELMNELKQQRQEGDITTINNNNDNNSINMSGSSSYRDLSGASRELGSSVGMSRGSFDHGDPNTTNLYIGNLAPTTTEEHLLDVFGQVGEINSVKVMWPRTDEERSRKRNCGFVSFKRRQDAEDALFELQDFELEGYRMIIGWGKAVKISQAPFSLLRTDKVNRYGSTATTTTAAAATGTGTVNKTPAVAATNAVAAADITQLSVDSFLETITATASSNSSNNSSSGIAQSVNESKIAEAEDITAIGATATTATDATATAAVSNEKQEQENKEAEEGEEELIALIAAGAACLRVQIPTHPRRRALLDLTAKYAAFDGEAFENCIKVREECNPEFSFLFESDSQEAIYYRWRTFANAWGDSAFEWRTAPVRMSQRGLIVLPPPIPATTAVAASTAATTATASDSKVVLIRDKDGYSAVTVPTTAAITAAATADEDEFSVQSDKSHDSRSLTSADSSYSSGSGSGNSSDSDESITAMQYGPGNSSNSNSRGRKRSRSNSPQQQQQQQKRLKRQQKQQQQQQQLPSFGHHDFRERERNWERADSSNNNNYDDAATATAAAATAATAAAARQRYAGMTGAQIERAKAQQQQQQQTQKLSTADYRSWQQHLKTLDLSNDAIKRAMGFAFDKLQHAEEIIRMIRRKLLLPSQHAAVKLAGLFLLADILHNAAAPLKNAGRYRSIIQAQLPLVFENIADLYRATTARITSRNISQRVRMLFAAWERSSVFSIPFLLGLQATFFMVEADRKLMLQRVAAAAADNSNTSGGSNDSSSGGSNDSSSGSSSSSGGNGNGSDISEDLSAARKKAKLLGLPFTARTSLAELQFKMQHAERFTQLRYHSSNNNSNDGGDEENSFSRPLMQETTVGATSAATAAMGKLQPLLETSFLPAAAVPINATTTATKAAIDSSTARLPGQSTLERLVQQEADAAEATTTGTAEEEEGDIDGAPLTDFTTTTTAATATPWSLQPLRGKSAFVEIDPDAEREQQQQQQQLQQQQQQQQQMMMIIEEVDGAPLDDCDIDGLPLDSHL